MEDDPRSLDPLCALVVQGRLGDNWLVGAMALLAACRPDKLRQLFVSRRYARRGLYTVKLHKVSGVGAVYV